jgi:hypothetical protein
MRLGAGGVSSVAGVDGAGVSCRMLHLGNGMGNLWVLLSIPIPIPASTHTNVYLYLQPVGMGFIIGH